MKRLFVCSMLLIAGCGARATKPAVRPDAARMPALTQDTTLGRVVVYRNGVAYFERHAHVTGDALVLRVPADKIDDLLKSLTVTDQQTKLPAPVAYRTEVGTEKDAVVEMTINLSGPAPHDLLLSYVAEAPAWKPSYRVVIGQDGEIDLQGWTVIDNASGEDWNGVRVGVGSSAALSFRHDLQSIRDVPRDTLRPNAPISLLGRTEDPKTPPSAATSPPPPPAPPRTEAIGSAQFESPVPMTLRRGTSAMISILHERTQGEIAYLYDPRSPSPDAQFPYRVLRLKNPTSSVLESGPFALFGEGRFIGEGLPDPIPAHGVAFISFALDRQVVVAPGAVTTREAIAKIGSIDNGLIQAEMRHTVKRPYVIKNRQSDLAVVYVRHAVASGFHLTTPASETLGEAQLFRVAVEPGAQTELTIEEEAPIARTVDVRTPGSLDLVQAFLEATPPDNPLRAHVTSLVAIDKTLREGAAREALLRREVAAFAERAAELKAQIAELRAARTGAPLQAELAKLLVDIERSQSKATAESAALKDSLTVSRIAFQNRAAELTLAPNETPLVASGPRGAP